MPETNQAPEGLHASRQQRLLVCAPLYLYHVPVHHDCLPSGIGGTVRRHSSRCNICLQISSRRCVDGTQFIAFGSRPVFRIQVVTLLR